MTTTRLHGRHCAADECDRTDITGYGYCAKHYQRYAKYGSPYVARKPGVTGGVDDTLSLWGLRTRFVDKVAFEPMSGCWFWLGAVDACGYGSIRVERKWWSAHRYAYETIVGTIPEDLEVDHICQVRNCVNPAHMELVPQAENKRRIGSRLMICRGGRHPRVPGGVYEKGTNKGRCKECVREASRKYSARKRMAAAPIKDAA